MTTPPATIPREERLIRRRRRRDVSPAAPTDVSISLQLPPQQQPSDDEKLDTPAQRRQRIGPPDVEESSPGDYIHDDYKIPLDRPDGDVLFPVSQYGMAHASLKILGAGINFSLFKTTEQSTVADLANAANTLLSAAKQLCFGDTPVGHDHIPENERRSCHYVKFHHLITTITSYGKFATALMTLPPITSRRYQQIYDLLLTKCFACGTHFESQYDQSRPMGRRIRVIFSCGHMICSACMTTKAMGGTQSILCAWCGITSDFVANEMQLPESIFEPLQRQKCCSNPICASTFTLVCPPFRPARMILTPLRDIPRPSELDFTPTDTLLCLYCVYERIVDMFLIRAANFKYRPMYNQRSLGRVHPGQITPNDLNPIPDRCSQCFRFLGIYNPFHQRVARLGCCGAFLCNDCTMCYTAILSELNMGRDSFCFACHISPRGEVTYPRWETGFDFSDATVTPLSHDIHYTLILFSFKHLSSRVLPRVIAAAKKQSANDDLRKHLELFVQRAKTKAVETIITPSADSESKCNELCSCMHDDDIPNEIADKLEKCVLCHNFFSGEGGEHEPHNLEPCYHAICKQCITEVKSRLAKLQREHHQISEAKDRINSATLEEQAEYFKVEYNNLVRCPTCRVLIEGVKTNRLAASLLKLIPGRSKQELPVWTAGKRLDASQLAQMSTQIYTQEMSSCEQQ